VAQDGGKLWVLVNVVIDALDQLIVVSLFSQDGGKLWVLVNVVIDALDQLIVVSLFSS